MTQTWFKYLRGISNGFTELITNRVLYPPIILLQSTTYTYLTLGSWERDTGAPSALTDRVEKRKRKHFSFSILLRFKELIFGLEILQSSTSYELLIFDRGARQESSWLSTTTSRPVVITSKCQSLIIQARRSLGIRASEHTRSRLNALVWRSTTLRAGLFSILSWSRKLVWPHRRCILRRKARSPRLLLLSMHMTLKSSRLACLTRAGNQTPTTWCSLRLLLYSSTSSAHATLNRLLLIWSANSSHSSWLVCFPARMWITHSSERALSSLPGMSFKERGTRKSDIDGGFSCFWCVLTKFHACHEECVKRHRCWMSTKNNMLSASAFLTSCLWGQKRPGQNRLLCVFGALFRCARTLPRMIAGFHLHASTCSCISKDRSGCSPHTVKPSRKSLRILCRVFISKIYGLVLSTRLEHEVPCSCSCT